MSSHAQRAQRREQRESTRRQILAAADRALRERPFRELSVEQLMGETGLTRTAFYRHFDDLTELVLQLLEDIGGELYGVAERWREAIPGDFEAGAREALAGIVGFFERHGPLVAAVAEAAATDEQIEPGYRGFIEAFIEMAASGFDELVTQGLVEPFDAQAMSRALNLMNERYLLDQLGRERRGDTAVVRTTLETIWLRAIGPIAAPAAG